MKEIIKTLNSIKTFIVMQTQLQKSILLELQKLNRKKLEVKNGKYK